MKPEMGIIIVRSKRTKKCLLEKSQNLKGMINRIKFQLGCGSYPNRELQKEWTEFGAGNFTIEVLEQLEYDKDEAKTDYTEELGILQMIWAEKMAQGGWEFYKR